MKNNFNKLTINFLKKKEAGKKLIKKIIGNQRYKKPLN